MSGGDITEDSVALANFNTQSPNWAAAGSISPDLSFVGPKTSVVFNNVNNVTTVITSTWLGVASRYRSAILDRSSGVPFPWEYASGWFRNR